MGYPQLEPTRVYVDNKSAIQLCKLLKITSKVKHINVRIQYIREQINNRVVELVFIPTELNVADILTKALHTTLHERHTDLLLHGHLKYIDSGVLSVDTFQYYMNVVENHLAALNLL